MDTYIWNQLRDSGELKGRAEALKANGLWLELRKVYLDKKNMYLQQNDTHHPSFVVYIEAVNEVYYNKYKAHDMIYSVTA